MIKNVPPMFVRSVLVALTVLAAATASAQTEKWPGASFLDDPEWRKSFMGSYGFLSGAEPEITTAELQMLREVIDVMKVNPKAAATMLAGNADEKSSAALDFLLANLYFQTQQLELAAAAYEQSLAKFPDYRRAHQNLGLLRVQQNELEKAIVHLSRAIELGSRDGKHYGLLGYAHLAGENMLAAEQAYRSAILAEPEVRDWKLGLAQVLLAMDRNKEASALFSGLIAANPTDAQAWLLQANAFLGMDDPMAAAVNLEAVRAMGKAQTSSLQLLGDIYMNAGMTGLAKEIYLEVMKRDARGSNFKTAYRSADLLIRAQAWDDATQVLAEAKEHYAGKIETDEELKLLTLEAKIARNQGRKKEAANLLASIIERDGTRGDAILELADYYRSVGDTERAVLLIERAQRLEAYERQALLAHAQVMVSERKYEKAAELLRQAQAIKSEPRVARYLARIEESIVATN